MRMFLLSSDTDVLTGMRLAGVGGKFVETEEDFDKAVCEVLKDESIGIMLVTYTLGRLFEDKLLEIKKKNKHIIITRIPDSKNPNALSDSISKYVADAIGI